MGVRLPSLFIAGPNGVTVAAGTETTLYTLPPISPSLDGAAVFLFGYCAFQIGTTSTSVTLRIRRGTGGAIITQTASVTVTAGQTNGFSICYIDQPGSVAGVQYVFTAQANASTQTVGLIDGAFIAMVL
jgi:hypothetical protein